MKTILFLFAAALCVAEVPIEKEEGPKALHAVPFAYADTGSIITGSALTIPTVARLAIQCGSGIIQIEYATGKVTLPEGVKLDDAAVQFWKAVASAFPDARKAIIGDGKTVEWVDMGPGASLNANRRPINVGLRSDGVVVWKDEKK